MTRLLLALVAALAMLAVPAAAQSPQPAKPKPGRAGLALDFITQKWTGDLDGMVERRLIRVLTVYSKTFFFVDKGAQRGIVHDAGRELEKALNGKLKTKHLRVEVAFVPVSRDELLPALVAGRGDIAAANLTITPERLQAVDFTDPWLTGVDEIVVTGPHSPPIATRGDLAGKEVFVRRSSSYYENLVKLNATFKQQGRAAVTLTPAPEILEDEDLLEMLNAGLVKALVVDSHKARFWKQVFPALTLHPDVAVDTGGEIAWAIRKDSPKLKSELNPFVRKHGKGSAFGNEVFRRYLKDTRYVKNATADAEMRKFKATIGMFRKYGDKYGIDWMLMTAQGYQESRLDQNVRSRVGAIGVMQVMPATGKELNVGDIKQIDSNIHAGVKYVRFMIDRYYRNEPMDDLNKGLFAFASYNAGPGRVAGLRREAAERGLDPNVWFNNVERIAAEKIGRETVAYVANIYKYYVAYSLVQGEYLERMEARKQLLPQK
ncbi:MAG: transglycosylase SLT domain-containing protein [Burkholderiales bacterium]